MKNIANILLLSALALPLFTACETDDNSNPVLNEPSSFTLNVPANATNNIYDLANAKTVELTCTQPDYGVPMATTYAIQVAMEAEFKEKTEESEANYVTLGTTFTSAKIAMDASELNAVLLNFWNEKHEGQDFPTDPMAVYIRLKAMITGSDNRGVCLSNVIELPKVLGTASARLEIPKKIFLNGAAIDADSKVWKPMVMIGGSNGEFWSMVYFKAGDTFKFGTKEKEYIGADDSRVTIKDDAEAGAGGVDDGTGGKNFKVDKAGWYIVYIKAAVKDNAYVFTLNFYVGEVYLFGATNGGVWNYDSKWKFEAPASADGDFVSPAMVGSGEARMCVKFGTTDWYRLEFTLFKGEIFYRENYNIANNWAQDMGPDYSVAGDAGKTVHLNFTKGTGALK